MRPSRDQYFLRMAKLVATRATCARRSVGCVLVNARGHVLATGYNGVPTGTPHCNQHDPFAEVGLPFACDGAFLPSGTGLDKCQAVHAEQNALLQCHDVHAIESCYCTTAPCITCVKLLMNTSCRRIVYAEDYPHADEASRLWLNEPGKLWAQLDVEADAWVFVAKPAGAAAQSAFHPAVKAGQP